MEWPIASFNLNFAELNHSSNLPMLQIGHRRYLMPQAVVLGLLFVRKDEMVVGSF